MHPIHSEAGEVKVLLLKLSAIAAIPAISQGRRLIDSLGHSSAAVSRSPIQGGSGYTRPAQDALFRDYVHEVVGAYTIADAAFAAGISQLTDAPPEWNQGSEGYGRRFGSNMGIGTVRTTTRNGLAEAFNEDTFYYPCQCSGVFPRLDDAALSTLTGRHRNDGHRVFSIPALVAPYAGTMVGVCGWYPNRCGAKDAFRMGNYGLQAYMGGNIALEFLNGRLKSFLSGLHLGNAYGAPDTEAEQ